MTVDERSERLTRRRPPRRYSLGHIALEALSGEDITVKSHESVVRGHQNSQSSQRDSVTKGRLSLPIKLGIA